MRQTGLEVDQQEVYVRAQDEALAYQLYAAIKHLSDGQGGKFAAAISILRSYLTNDE